MYKCIWSIRAFFTELSTYLDVDFNLFHVSQGWRFPTSRKAYFPTKLNDLQRSCIYINING